MLKKKIDLLEIALIIFVILLALATLVVLFIKLPKANLTKSIRLRSAFYCIVYIAILTVSLLSFRASGILLSEHTKNLASAYKNYGFNYCFVCSMFDLGVDKPSQYDKYDVEKIVSAANSNEKGASLCT